MQNTVFDTLIYPLHKQKQSLWYLVTCLLLCPSLVFAYIGPGLGAGAIALIAIIAFSILLAIFSLIWYPLKAKMKQKKSTVVFVEEDSANTNTKEGSDESLKVKE